MAFNLIIEPHAPQLTWKKFCEQKQAPAIALDGYVLGGPHYSEKGPYFNFNHHEGVDRLATRATCGQIRVAINQGFYDCLIAQGCRSPHGNVYARDCDEDVCVSWVELKYCWMKKYAYNIRLSRLVSIEDLLDSTAGAYCYPPEMSLIRKVGWVFEPYRSFRLHGGTDKADAHEYKKVIFDVEKRILDYINGKGKSIRLDTRYEIIGGGPGWVMVKEIGLYARTGMFADGIRAYVSVHERSDGKFSHVVARMSPYIHFPIPKFCRRFNAVEQCTTDLWGGSHICIGSPQFNGSNLTPQFLQKDITRILKNEK